MKWFKWPIFKNKTRPTISKADLQWEVYNTIKDYSAKFYSSIRSFIWKHHGRFKIVDIDFKTLGEDWLNQVEKTFPEIDKILDPYLIWEKDFNRSKTEAKKILLRYFEWKIKQFKLKPEEY